MRIFGIVTGNSYFEVEADFFGIDENESGDVVFYKRVPLRWYSFRKSPPRAVAAYHGWVSVTEVAHG